jgi:hypothetical protein
LVVHDEDSLEAAVVLVLQGPIKYSDEYAYRTVSSERALRSMAANAFARGDVAVVASLGQEHLMEVHSVARRLVREQRNARERAAVKRFLAENPEIRKAESVEEALKLFRARQKRSK